MTSRLSTCENRGRDGLGADPDETSRVRHYLIDFARAERKFPGRGSGRARASFAFLPFHCSVDLPPLLSCTAPTVLRGCDGNTYPRSAQVTNTCAFRDFGYNRLGYRNRVPASTVRGEGDKAWEDVYGKFPWRRDPGEVGKLTRDRNRPKTKLVIQPEWKI